MNTIIKAVLSKTESKRLTRYLSAHGYPKYYDAINHSAWMLKSFFIKELRP